LEVVIEAGTHATNKSLARTAPKQMVFAVSVVLTGPLLALVLFLAISSRHGLFYGIVPAYCYPVARRSGNRDEVARTMRIAPSHVTPSLASPTLASSTLRLLRMPVLDAVLGILLLMPARAPLRSGPEPL
jgi:hypothetical protein